MKRILSVGILFLFVIGLLCCAYFKKDPVVQETIEDSEVLDVSESTPDALDVLLGNTDEDLLVMNVQDEVKEENAEIVKIYYSSKDFSHMMVREEELKQKTPDTILTALALHNIVTLDTKNLAFSLSRAEDGKTCVYLNLNKKFGAYVNTMSAASEELILAALTDTFLDNYEADELLLMVEGEPIETTHNTYDAPFVHSDYEVEIASGENTLFFDKKIEDK